MLGAGNLDDNTIDTAVHGPFDVIHHTTAEREYLRAQVAFDYLLDGGLILR